jgi:hypothetical protein
MNENTFGDALAVILLSNNRGLCDQISGCWYHQLGTVFTVKWTAYMLEKQSQLIHVDSCVPGHVLIPLNPTRQEPQLSRITYTKQRHVVFAYSDGRICPDSYNLFQIYS